jgi:hypothetical protein
MKDLDILDIALGVIIVLVIAGLLIAEVGK